MKTTIVIVHLLGLALGVGTATIVELMMLQFLRGHRITAERYRVVELASQVIFLGLVVLWISGVAFLVNYYVFDPEGLTNPKVWAKVSIVMILTLNGFYIHRSVLPLLKRNIGFSLFHGISESRKSMLLASGAISLISWYTPLILGAVRELNHVYPADTILGAYVLLVAAAILVAQIIGRVLDTIDIRHISHA